MIGHNRARLAIHLADYIIQSTLQLIKAFVPTQKTVMLNNKSFNVVKHPSYLEAFLFARCIPLGTVIYPNKDTKEDSSKSNVIAGTNDSRRCANGPV